MVNDEVGKKLKKIKKIKSQPELAWQTRNLDHKVGQIL